MMRGLNALQIILASGFSGVTDLGHVPEPVLALVSLPDRVTPNRQLTTCRSERGIR